MPASYAIGDHFEEFIKRQIEGGRYASASEVVRDALRPEGEHNRVSYQWEVRHLRRLAVRFAMRIKLLSA